VLVAAVTGGVVTGGVMTVGLLTSGSGGGALAAQEPQPRQAPEGPLARCEEGFAAAPEARESARCFRRAVNRDPSLRQEALRRLELLRRRHPDNPRLLVTLANLEWRSFTERVPDLYAEAARLFAERGEVEDELTARVSQGRFLTYVGRVEEAVPVLERLAARATELGEMRFAVGARIETARLRLQRGEVEAAWNLLHEPEVGALAEAPGAVGSEVRGDWLYLRGRACFELGRYAEAQRAFRTWLEERSNPYQEASVRQLLAAAHLSSALPTEGERQRALRLLEEALEAAQRGDNPGAEAQVHRFLGKLLDGPEAERHLRRCVELVQELQGANSLAALCQGALALHLAESAPAEAKFRIERARAAALRAREEPWSRIFAELDRMRVDRVLLPRERFLQRAFGTLRLIEQSLVVRSGGEARARVRSQWLDPYHWVAGRLLEGGDGEGDGESEPKRADVRRAFTVIERMRAQTLAEALRAAGRRDGEEPGVDEAVGTLAEAIELAEVEASLAPDEALLSYQVGSWRNLYGEFEGGAWLLASTRRGTRVYRLPGLAVLAPDVRRLEGLEDPERVPVLLVRLHRQLLAPALRELPPDIRRLVIVPDGPLHRLPFALLRSRPAATASLVARYELSVVPSATLWRHWRREGFSPFRSPALVLADPVLKTDGRTAVPAVASPAASRGDPSLGPLPHARAEGRAVIERLGGGELRVGADASEAALAREPLSAAYALLHLAAHARSDSRDPERSAVFLAPGGGEDGRLTPAEILELELRDRLVVLAACETGAGELLRGEGVLSLGRYFFQAGARGVVASLWDLPDEAAAELFDRFYHHLATGEPLAGALAAAQRELLAAGGPARVWGGVVVFGDGMLRPFPEGRTPTRPPARRLAVLLVATLASGAVLLALLWALRRRRARR